MLSLFNTATGRIEPLAPSSNSVSLYVCGVTPYDTTHLGHAFAYVTFDSLVRYLRSEGIAVRYAQNVTDIDDDILRKSKELGLEYDELAARETAQFKSDMRALNVVEPDAFVPATSTIPEIVEAVQCLLERGAAYIAGGNVYFDNRRFEKFGTPFRGSREEMLQLAAEHGGFPDDPNKRDRLDFLLWQGQLPGEPSWPSPFGAGRPGWHIECSTIATRELGFPIDIHGGGSDLIFPHHAGELAQAETIHNHGPFVRHWMHNAMVRMDGEKMSKSLGNMVFVRDLVRRYSSDAIRLYLLGHHYRDPFEWDEAELRERCRLAEYIAEDAAGGDGAEQQETATIKELRMHIEDDFHTDRVVSHLSSVALSGQRTGTGVGAWAAKVLGLNFNPAPVAESTEASVA